MTTLALHLSPGVNALSSVVSVLHARRVDIEALRYETRYGRPWVTIRVGPAIDAERLAEYLRRRVDVQQAVVSAERRDSPTVMVVTSTA